MRRSICLLVMMLVMTYGYSQNKEPKYLIEEIEVTDTAKAMAMAEQKKVELKSGIKNDEKIVKEEVALLKYIGNHNKKKIKMRIIYTIIQIRNVIVFYNRKII